MKGRAARRGSTLVESAVVATAFLVLLTGVMEFGCIGFAYNAVSFAAQRAARYAAVRGAGSGHPASAADVQAAAKVYTGALDNSKVTVTTTWLPDNQAGSTVQVKVSYSFAVALVPISAKALTLQTTSRHIITQ
ncbi:MAG TPA: TadE family protein [Candidatus Sulfopaludibacter sp.]|nr:TadE family protein [Candidatus Sulfopaludibacter sp.]